MIFVAVELVAHYDKKTHNICSWTSIVELHGVVSGVLAMEQFNYNGGHRDR